MYTIDRTNSFKKTFKKCVKRGFPIESFEEVIEILRQTGTLPSKYYPHKLNAKYDFAWECHITSDWLLLWKQNDTELTLLLVDTGTHSDIF